MKKATKIFIILGIIAGALNILTGFIDVASGEEMLVATGIGTIIGGLISAILSICALKHLNAAQCASDIKTGWKVVTLLFVNIVAGILMFCLKDEHFDGYYSYSSSSEGDYSPSNESYYTPSSQPSAAPAASGNLDELSTRLAKLKELYDSGAITQEEYDKQKDILFDTYQF